MPLTKCERCEKLFDKVKGVVCPACTPAEESDYELIRECLTDNPDLNAEAMSELTGVAVSCVLRMVDSGQISHAEYSATVKCGRCGEPAISATKKLCHGCLEKMNQKIAKQRKSVELNRKKNVEIGQYGGISETIQAKRKS